MNPSGDVQAKERIRRIRERATRHLTEGPGGSMVWHEWGGGPALVLLHGGLGSWTHWLESIEHFARSWRVIAGDLPGLGDSASPAEPYDGDSLAAIVSAGLDQLLAVGEGFHLVGFSFGGIVSGHLAPLQAARIRSVTLIGSPLFGLPSTGLANELIPVDPALDFDRARPLHRKNLANLMLADASRIDALALRIHHDNLRRARLASRKIARTDGLSVALDRAPCPVRGIWGESDVTVHPDMAALRTRILATGPGASFHVMTGAGHWVMYEDPAAFNAVLSERLGLPGPGTAR